MKMKIPDELFQDCHALCARHNMLGVVIAGITPEGGIKFACAAAADVKHLLPDALDIVAASVATQLEAELHAPAEGRPN